MFCPTPKIGISERVQSFFGGVILLNHFFQMVTYHLSKNLSPRIFLVFMANHSFENFSPHTFLVFMENHGFELYGLIIK